MRNWYAVGQADMLANRVKTFCRLPLPSWRMSRQRNYRFSRTETLISIFGRSARTLHTPVSPFTWVEANGKVRDVAFEPDKADRRQGAHCPEAMLLCVQWIDRAQTGVPVLQKKWLACRSNI